MPKHDKLHRPRCGACDAEFATGPELVKHLDACTEAQDSPYMAMFRMGRAIDLLADAVNEGRGTLEELDRWQDDGGKG